MKLRVSTYFYFMVVTIALTLAAPVISSANFGVYAQSNRISGYVFGMNRQPVDRLNVELMDEWQRAIKRTLTSGSGYYQFENIRDGIYVIKVNTVGTDYEEQEHRVELYNPLGGLSYEQSDFHLKLRRGVTHANAAVFVQDIPPAAQKLYDSAIEHLQNKRNTEGVKELMSALEIFPKYFAALERLGLEYIQMGSTETYQAAEILLNSAIETNPRSFKSWFGLAYARNLLLNYPEAIKAVEKAIEISPSSADALILYGRLLRNEKKYSDAEKQLLKAKALSPEVTSQLHWELALLYGNNLKKYAEAAKELKLYLKLNPNVAKEEEIKKLIAEFEAKAAIK